MTEGWTFGNVTASTTSPPSSRKRKPTDEAISFPSMLPNSSTTSQTMSMVTKISNTYINLHTPSKRYKTGNFLPEYNTQQLLSPLRSPTPPISRPPSIEKVLQTLEKNQLITLLTTLIQQHPTLSSNVASMLPRPTIKSVAALLSNLEKKLNDAYPYSRWAPDRSDYSFNRVRPILIEIKDSIIHYLPYFVEPGSFTRETTHEYPDHAFEFLKMSTSIVHRLPLWQNVSHNDEIRGDLYLVIGRGWNTACAELIRRVKEEGKMFASSVIAEWGQDLLTHAEHVGGRFGFAEAVEMFRSSCGWMAPVLTMGGNNHSSALPYAWMAAGPGPGPGTTQGFSHQSPLSQQYH